MISSFCCRDALKLTIADDVFESASCFVILNVADASVTPCLP
jgi:hypothetical protein